MKPASFSLLFSIVAPHRKAVIGASALLLMDSAVSLILPWLGGRFAGGVFGLEQFPGDGVLVALLGLFVVQALLRFASSSVAATCSESILADLRSRIYDHLQALPLDFHHRTRRGENLALLSSDAERLAGYVSGTILGLVPRIALVFGSVIVMIRMDLLLAAIVGILVPLTFVVLLLLGRHLRSLGASVQGEYARTIGIADENLATLPAIKAFVRETQESDRYFLQVRRLARQSLRQARVASVIEPVVQVVAGSAVVLLLWLASDQIGSGQMTPAEMVAFLLYAFVLIRPVSGLATVYGQTQQVRGALGRLLSVLAETPEQLHAGQVLPAVCGRIDFDAITFAYHDRQPVLKGLNLSIAAGETIALTGANGVGKSTLVHLLMRLYEPLSGRVMLDGIDIRYVSLASLRSQIGIVPQSVVLMDGSIRDNIAFGCPGASDEDIVAAARLAQAHRFISHMPQGYGTLIGDQGVRLSGGQRQRLALARVLLKNPPILVLDEATSMFDPDGEQLFIEACAKTLGERTVILITHRPASLRLADRVFRIVDGRAFEER